MREQTDTSPTRAAGRIRLAHLFLTRLRFGDVETVTAAGFARAVVVFPLVGVTVGAVGAVARAAADPLGTTPACIAAVAATALVTGALHEDGLADTADALGPHERSRRLEAMRDTRLGAFGVLAIVLTVAARVALLAELSLRDCVLALVAGHVLGRWSSLPHAAWCAPAHPDGSAVLARISPRQALAGSLIAAVPAAAALASVALTALVAFPVAGVVTTISAIVWLRAFGGVTGDTYGATNQLVEVATYATIILAVS